MRYKLAIIDSHPIQYRAPLFKKISQTCANIDLIVYYCSDRGVTRKLDSEFNTTFKWDIPLLEGYRYKFLKNLIPFVPVEFLFNPVLALELKKERFDAVIIYGYASLNNWIIVLLAPILNIKVIFIGDTIISTERQSKVLSAIKKLLLKLFFGNIKSFLYVGSKSREFYQYHGISEERIFFTPCCVDNDFFINQVEKYRISREKIKKELGIPKELSVIMYASKMIPKKRPQDLLYAFKRINRKAALVFIGNGKLKPSLENYVKENQFKYIFFLGFKNQTELPRYYAIADIFVLPSSYEPWGLVVNEAMCAGLPVITTDRVAAAYDLVKNGENGYVLKVGDIESLAKLLEELASNAQKRRCMGLKSKGIISGWNYDVCVNGIIDALRFINSRPDLGK